MGNEQFVSLCNLYGFAPSRAMKEIIDTIINLTKLEERELCAQVCEDHFSSDGHWCAAAIRARSNP